MTFFGGPTAGFSCTAGVSFLQARIDTAMVSNVTVDWGRYFMPDLKQVKAWRWFDIFRTPEVIKMARAVTLLAAKLWRRQERSDKLQQRKQKRRHFVQSLHAA